MVHKIDYIDLMELGFERDEADDDVWWNEYGFEYFIVNKRLSDNIIAEWDVIEHTVRILKIDGEGSILNELDNIPLYILKKAIKYCKKKNKKGKEILWDSLVEKLKEKYLAGLGQSL